MLERTDRSSLCHMPLPALFAVVTGALVCVSPAVLNDGDTFTHIAAGRWVLENGSVLRADPLTATFAGAAWPAHEWLSELLLGAAYRAGVLAGVVALTAGAAAVALGNLLQHVGRWAGWRTSVALTMAALLCVVPSVFARPHVLALPLLEAWMAGLVAARAAGRAPGWGMLGVMTAWANLQGGFAFGIAMAGALALEATLQAALQVAEERAGGWRGVGRWWGFVAGSAAAASLTPQGWDGLLFPLRLLQLDSLRLIREWAPTDFHEQVGVAAAVAGLVAVLGTGRVRVPPFRMVLVIGLLYLTAAHARHAPLLGIAGVLLLAEAVGRGFPEQAPGRSGLPGLAAGWLGLLLVAGVRLAVPIAQADSRVTPVSAMAQVPREVVETPVLNSTLFGGYLELVGVRPFIDGRVELFGDGFVSAFAAMSEGGSNGDGELLRRAVERHGIRWAILAAGDPLVARFRSLAGWREQYVDEVATVFVRG